MLGRFFKKKNDYNKKVFAVLLLFALIPLLAAFVLSVEKIHLLENPAAPLSCSLNSVLNCASVMKTPQASVFGFPNSYLGLMFFPVVMAFAAMGLLKTKFPRKVILILESLSVLALGFAYWLFYQSVYVIQILCPWCLLVTLSTTVIFAALTHYMLRHNSLELDKSTNKKALNFINSGYDVLLTAAVIMLLIILIFAKFGDSLFLS